MTKASACSRSISRQSGATTSSTWRWVSMPGGPSLSVMQSMTGPAVEVEALERAGDIVRYRGAAVRVDDENAGAHGAFPRGGTRPVVSTIRP